MHEVAGMVNPEARTYSAGINSETQLEAEPLVTEEMPQEKQPVPALVILNVTQMANVIKDIPNFIMKQQVFQRWLSPVKTF